MAFILGTFLVRLTIYSIMAGNLMVSESLFWLWVHFQGPLVGCISDLQSSRSDGRGRMVRAAGQQVNVTHLPHQYSSQLLQVELGELHCCGLKILILFPSRRWLYVGSKGIVIMIPCCSLGSGSLWLGSAASSRCTRPGSCRIQWHARGRGGDGGHVAKKNRHSESETVAIESLLQEKGKKSRVSVQKNCL